MIRRSLFAVVLIGAFVGATAPAHAGGSTWSLDRESYAPGDIAFAWASVSWEHSPELGTPGDGPYTAFVVRAEEVSTTGVGPFPVIPAGAVRVGELAISLEPYGAGPVKFGPHHATVTFEVPDLPPGDYLLLHCNATCTKTLGDITWGAFKIDAPPAAPEHPATSRAQPFVSAPPPDAAGGNRAEPALDWTAVTLIGAAGAGVAAAATLVARRRART